MSWVRRGLNLRGIIAATATRQIQRQQAAACKQEMSAFHDGYLDVMTGPDACMGLLDYAIRGNGASITDFRYFESFCGFGWRWNMADRSTIDG